MNFCADQLLLYAVTDRAWVGRQTLLEQIEDALQGGVTMVQLREKELPEDAFTAEAMEVKALCHRYGVPLLIDDNVDVALKSGADGVHVGIEDTPVAEIRARAGRDFIIGSTAKTVEQARAAQAAGADYLGVGAVFPTGSKDDAKLLDHQVLRDICDAVSIPVIAIGGITRENVQELAGTGICGVAVISAIYGQSDVRQAAREMKEKVADMVSR